MCSVQGLMYIKLQPTNKRNSSLSPTFPEKRLDSGEKLQRAVPFRSPDRRPRGSGG